MGRKADNTSHRVGAEAEAAAVVGVGVERTARTVPLDESLTSLTRCLRSLSHLATQLLTRRSRQGPLFLYLLRTTRRAVILNRSLMARRR